MVVYMEGFRGSSVVMGVTCPLGGALTQLKTLLLLPSAQQCDRSAGSGSLLKQNPSFFPSWQCSDVTVTWSFTHACKERPQLPAGSSLWC